jgi:hypothetical protein
MKFINQEKGFTLIETLVVINLSFFVITMIVSFYLLTNKYFVGTTRTFEEKHAAFDFLFKLEEMLNKSDHYSLAMKENTVQLINNGDTTLFSGDKIAGHRMSNVEGITKYEFRIKFLSGRILTVDNVNIGKTFNPGANKVFISDSIESLEFMIEKGKMYNCNIYNKSIPANRFRNL